MDFDSSQTKINLARVFSGECQDGARYQFIAQKALAEGKKNIEILMKGLAKNEMAHAKTVWDLISRHSKEVQRNIDIKAGFPFEDDSLIEMIKFTSQNEKSENSSIYPSFAKIAEDEGFDDVAEILNLIAKVENNHFMILDELYNKMKGNALFSSSTNFAWTCNSCGHVEYGKEAFKTCPLCGATRDYIDLSTVIDPKK